MVIHVVIDEPGAVSEQVRCEASLLRALPVCAAQDGGPVSVLAGSSTRGRAIRTAILAARARQQQVVLAIRAAILQPKAT